MKKLISIIAFVSALFSFTLQASDAGHTGKVLEVINAGGYSYVLLDKGSEQAWFAGPQSPITVGQEVTISEPGIAMKGFHSKSLNRDFEVVYFVNSFGGGMASPQPTISEPSVAEKVEVAALIGGVTVEDVFTQKDQLSNKEVSIRAKVVKFSPQIMGKNWVHIQDGTGSAKMASNDLTVTTAETARVGDTVIITGKVTLDKDFGFGYKYDVMLEEARIKVE
ncbi:OB-fold nucleic acid binding domain-containing protein [Vibrio sp. HN007]|uniref:OB-fold nucleic acid binding domain-containing protein n=1 Tax=Vibrio iocasae TaxID=3098914 RepID=UPI0035D4F5A8